MAAHGHACGCRSWVAAELEAEAKAETKSYVDEFVAKIVASAVHTISTSEHVRVL